MEFLVTEDVSEHLQSICRQGKGNYRLLEAEEDVTYLNKLYYKVSYIFTYIADFCKNNDTMHFEMKADWLLQVTFS